MISILDSVICWDDETKKIEVQRLDFYRAMPRTMKSWGACNSEISKLKGESNFEKRKALVFINAFHFIVAYGLNPIVVHNALLEIIEYKDGCSNEIDYKQ